GLSAWVIENRERLRQRFAELALPALKRVDGQLAGRVLERLQQELPFDDAVTRARIEHVARHHGLGAARKVYAAFESELQAELGVAPEPETRALAEAPVSAPVAPPKNQLNSLAGLPRLLLLPPRHGPYAI